MINMINGIDTGFSVATIQGSSQTFRDLPRSPAQQYEQSSGNDIEQDRIRLDYSTSFNRISFTPYFTNDFNHLKE